MEVVYEGEDGWVLIYKGILVAFIGIKLNGCMIHYKTFYFMFIFICNYSRIRPNQIKYFYFNIM